ncbi:MAG: suppressor of fused domain protein [Betaproteobacteria bacterium]|nr:suppressor of fused domain protein [Betaproteobacteria bacterium]
MIEESGIPSSRVGEVLMQYIERYLGPIDQKLVLGSGTAREFFVLRFPGKPEPADQSLVTFGLSTHLLEISGRDERIRMEFVICANASFDSKILAVLLVMLGEMVLESHSVPGVHCIYPCGSPIIIGGDPRFEYAYLSFPGYLPSEFEVCDDLKPPVRFMQVIPITANEVEFIKNNGWRAFEDAFDEQEIDLMEFGRRREVKDPLKHAAVK